MEEYSNRYTLKQTQGGFSERNRFHIGFFMSELALDFKKHGIALCFLGDIKGLLEANVEEVGPLFNEIDKSGELEYIEEYIERNEKLRQESDGNKIDISYPCVG